MPTQPQRMQAWRNAGANPDEKPRAAYKLVSVFDRLSRVRSGGCRRRPSREIRCLPVSRLVARPRQRHGEGDGCGLRGRRGVGARGRRRSGDRARLAGTPGNRSALTRCRECRHPVPIPAISRTDGKLPKAAALHQEQRRRQRGSRGCITPGAAASLGRRGCCSCACYSGVRG